MGIKEKLTTPLNEISENGKRQRAARDAAEAAKVQRRGNFYTTTITIPVHWGNTTGTTGLTDCIADADAQGWELVTMTTVYAEKVGVNNLIHTLVFRPKPTPERVDHG